MAGQLIRIAHRTEIDLRKSVMKSLKGNARLIYSFSQQLMCDTTTFLMLNIN